MKDYYLVLKALLLSWLIGSAVVEAAACTAPATAQFSHSHLTSNSAQLNASAEGIAFQFAYKLSTSSVWQYTGSPYTSPKIISGLTAGSTYQYAMRRQCSNGVWSAWSAVKTFAPQSATCTAPAISQLNATNITTTSARLESNLTGEQHKFRYRAVGSTAWINTPTTEYCYIGPWDGVQCVQISNLQPGTTYEYQAARQCSNGAWSPWSSSKTFTTPAATCTAPTTSEFTVTNLTATSAQLSTTAVGNAFQFRYKLASSSAWTETGTPYTSPKSISGLLANTSYHYAVRRQCSNGVWSPWSSSKTFTTPAAVECVAPTLSQFWHNAVSDWSVALEHSLPGTGNPATSYFRFSFRILGTNSWSIGQAFTGNTVTVANFQPGTSYEYRLQRYCANAQWGPWSAVKTFSIVCTAMTGFSHSNVTANSATLSRCTSCVSATAYRFRYRITGNNNWTTSVDFTGISINITGLTSGVTYEYQIARRCISNEWSAWSPSKTFNTTCPPATTNQFWHGNVGTNSVTFHHAAPGTAFQIRYRKVGNNSWTTPNSFTGSSTTITNFSTGTAYEYQFRRRCSSGEWSAWSDSKTFNTICPEPPLNKFSHNNVTENSVRLNRTEWGTEFQFRYRVQPSGGWITPDAFTGNFINITGLSSGTTYEYQFRKRCVSGDWSAWSASKIFGTVCPQLTTAQFWHTNVTPTSAILVTNAAGVSFQFHYVYTGNGTTTAASSSNAHAISVSPGRTYHYKVRRICSNGGPWSAWSPTRSFTTPSNFNLSAPETLVVPIAADEWLRPELEDEDTGDVSEGAVQLPEIGVTVPVKAEVVVFPNPTRSTVQFRAMGEAGGTLHLRLLDMRGQVVRTLVQTQQYDGQADLQFDLSGLPSGTYLLQGAAGKTPVSERIIKMD
ncbi:MAG: T9SS type A sorting domain-containing protein [Saprospiraceae bacterium]|nr:T9SS type A sorting domain-containing protein [Saprospiraceae bacterium]